MKYNIEKAMIDNKKKTPIEQAICDREAELRKIVAKEPEYIIDAVVDLWCGIQSVVEYQMRVPDRVTVADNPSFFTKIASDVRIEWAQTEPFYNYPKKLKVSITLGQDCRTECVSLKYMCDSGDFFDYIKNPSNADIEDLLTAWGKVFKIYTKPYSEEEKEDDV